MEIQKFNQAKYLREQIDHLQVKKLQIENMKKREDDKEFELARQLAHDGICYSLKRLNEDFTAL
jgi:hypothetical protein